MYIEVLFFIPVLLLFHSSCAEYGEFDVDHSFTEVMVEDFRLIFTFHLAPRGLHAGNAYKEYRHMCVPCCLWHI